MGRPGFAVKLNDGESWPPFWPGTLWVFIRSGSHSATSCHKSTSRPLSIPATDTLPCDTTAICRTTCSVRLRHRHPPDRMPPSDAFDPADDDGAHGPHPSRRRSIEVRPLLRRRRHPRPRCSPEPAHPPGRFDLELPGLGRHRVGRGAVQRGGAGQERPDRLCAAPAAALRGHRPVVLPPVDRGAVRALRGPGAGRLPLRGEGAGAGDGRAGARRTGPGPPAQHGVSGPGAGDAGIRHPRAGGAGRQGGRAGVPAQPAALFTIAAPAAVAGAAARPAAGAARCARRHARRRGGGGGARPGVALARHRAAAGGRAQGDRRHLLPGTARQDAAPGRAVAHPARALARADWSAAGT